MQRKDAVSDILAAGKKDPALRLLKAEPEDIAADLLAPSDPRHYQALITGQKLPRLVIHCASGPSRSPPYIALMDVVFDRRFGASFALIYNHMFIIVTGRNLVPLANAICRHRAAVITEYDPQAFDAPIADVPVIEGIEVQVGEGMTETMREIPETV
jgi:hypothetical protein